MSRPMQESPSMKPSTRIEIVIEQPLAERMIETLRKLDLEFLIDDLT